MARAGHDILAGKGYTNDAVAMAAVRIIEAMLYEEHQVLDDTMTHVDAQLRTRLTADQAGQLRALLDLPAALGAVGPLVTNPAA